MNTIEMLELSQVQIRRDLSNKNIVKLQAHVIR